MNIKAKDVLDKSNLIVASDAEYCRKGITKLLLKSVDEAIKNTLGSTTDGVKRCLGAKRDIESLVRSAAACRRMAKGADSWESDFTYHMSQLPNCGIWSELIESCVADPIAFNTNGMYNKILDKFAKNEYKYDVYFDGGLSPVQSQIASLFIEKFRLDGHIVEDHWKYEEQEREPIRPVYFDPLSGDLACVNGTGATLIVKENSYSDVYMWAMVCKLGTVWGSDLPSFQRALKRI